MMKQKFWKELKSRLCPRQKWRQDEFTTKCQCCGKMFRCYRRKHHCRFCGKIFCSHCSDLYINGTYLGLSQKYVRHCEFCKKEIQKIKEDLNQLTYMVEEEEEMVLSIEDKESESSEDQDSQFFSIRQVFGTIQKDQLEKITEDLDAQARNIVKKIFRCLIEAGSMSEEFEASKLLQVITRMLFQLKMNILPQELDSSDHYMDVGMYVSIMLVPGEPGEVIELVPGVVLEKGFSVKGMETYFVHPQVIIVENSMDESAVRLKFEDLVQNDKQVYSLLQQKIMRLNPDVIFVQKNINRQMLRYFCEHKICVINGLKKKQLERIAKLAGIKNAIKNILTTDKYQKQRFLGDLSSVKIIIKPNFRESLIYLQKDTGVYTLVVSERPQYHHGFRKIVQTLMVLIRQIHLEKYLIYVDADIWQERLCAQRGRLYRLNIDYKNIIDRLRPFRLIFYKVEFKELNAKSLQKSQEEYCRLLNREYMLDICGEGGWHQIEPYSQSDITLGHYLLIMATYLIKKCRTCRQMHRQRYYFRDRGVQITGMKMKQEHHKESSILNQKDLTMQNMHRYLKKYKQNSNIFTYFRCEDCGQIMTKKSKVGKNYLKNSFHYFLQLISHTLVPNNNQITTPNRRKNSSLYEHQLNDCSHLDIQRYLSTFNMEFRLQVFGLHTYQLQTLDFSTIKVRKIIQTKITNYIYGLVKKTVIQRGNILITVNNWLMASLNSLQQMRMLNAQTKVIERLERFQKIKKLLDQIQDYLKDISEKEVSKEVKIDTDWTYFTRAVTKMDSVLKDVVQILIRFENKFNKKILKLDNLTQGSTKNADPQDTSWVQQQIIVETFFTEKIWRKKSIDIQDSPERQLDGASEKQQTNNLKQNMQQLELNLPRRTSNTFSTTFSTTNIENDQMLKNFMADMKKRRYQLKRGHHVYFSPINLKDHITILAFALASQQFSDLLTSCSQGGASAKVFMQAGKDISTSWEIKQQFQEIKVKELGQKELDRQTYEITAYYHKQFQTIREDEGISYDMYVRSLTSAQKWQDNSGGKSNSMFAKSSDSLLVVKTIKDEEFIEFQKFAPGYIDRLTQSKAQGRSSLLTKIFGLYELTIKGSSYKCVVMQNLFFNLDDTFYKVYDLKGSWINRLSMPDGSSQNFTGLDTNFKIDKNHQPYIFKQEVYKQQQESLQEDIAFLSKNEVIDYSLLVIQHDRQLRLGVIDFMRPYHFKQMVEHKFKGLKYGQDPTVLPPQEYANRFIVAFKKYFMPKASQVPHN